MKNFISDKGLVTLTYVFAVPSKISATCSGIYKHLQEKKVSSSSFWSGH